jgi:hypothetical protein
MTEATGGRRRRYVKKATTKNLRRPGALGERIRPQVRVPEELRATASSVQKWNELLEDCHNQAIFAAWDEKLKLLLRHYSLADGDWYGLALILAVEHEPGFQIDGQIAPLPPGFWGAVEIKDGKIVDDKVKKSNRPLEWPFRRLLELLDDVETEKKKSGCSKDLTALRHIVPKKWGRPLNYKGDIEAWIRRLQKLLSEARRQHRAAAPGAAKLATAAKVIQRQLADNSGNSFD